VISNTKFNHKLGQHLWRIWCSPIQRGRRQLYLQDLNRAFQRWPPTEMTCLNETLNWHTQLETLWEFWSCHLTCVLCSFMAFLTPKPLMAEESHRVYNCDNECLSWSTKCWIFRSL